MASDQELTKDVAEARTESDQSGDGRVAQDRQVKSGSQKEAEQQQSLDRKLFNTPSSESLPRVHLSGDFAAQAAPVGEKTAKGQEKSGDRADDRSAESGKNAAAKPS